MAPLDPAVLPEAPEVRALLLAEENDRLRRICGALIERVESSGVPGGAPYAAFEHSVLLAEQVRERTETLQRTLGELHRAKAEAEAANLSKTKFLAAVSHDLLQPLNAARLFASALEEQPLQDGSRRLVANIGRSLKDVEALIGSLVDISRLDAGVLRPDIAPFPAEELLDVLAEEYRQMAAARGLAFHYVTTRAVVETDLSLLARVVRNFLGNAIRYTAHGRILLGCRRRRGGLEILVGDTGPGIALGQQREIFEEFRRLESCHWREDRGLGLGLAIVDRISGMLGHPLRLVSVPGRGSLFSVTVPYAAAARLSSGRLDPPPIGPPLFDQVVWVLDNDAAIRDGMEALLGSWGCRVVAVGSSCELERRIAEPGNVLLVDYHLGEGQPHGLKVANRLRETFPWLPVVVITANHDAALKSRIRQAGYHCLLKPIKPLRLRMLLTSLLGSQPERRPAR